MLCFIVFVFFVFFSTGVICLQEFINSPIYPVMIISYEMFLRSVEEIRSIKFGLVICDEAHRLKNTTIKTATVRASWFVLAVSHSEKWVIRRFSS